MVMLELALIFLGALFVSITLTPLARHLGARYGLVDRPRAGEIQSCPVARTGGYAIVLSFMVALVLSLLLFSRSLPEYLRIYGFLLGALLIIPAALWDDIKRVGPLPQLGAQALIALVPISFGLLIDDVANPFGGIVNLPLYVALPFTFFWILGLINTVNFLDTMDGLAAGVTIIAATILFVRSFELEQYTIAVLPLALAGACAGFLPYNFNPARVFMGTSGSLFLGYSLAILAIIGGAKIATALMVLGIPILDVALVIIQRLIRRRSPLVGGDSAHLPHHLFAIGISQRRIVFLLYGLCLTTGWLALALSSIQKLYLFSGTALIFTIFLVALALRRYGSASVDR
ncbi:MAG: undecaprenyl/decaprenyl-phosphate alpha-N-acetylglucosaminyl 1-phosphate transferase [Chloroflexi bacterium]|nr:undecaprenyl/decaprenyl-phosphate alpha-N-acetylglucosaminyl 1-phosphate transferase [Chloroflexota bacterium]MCL5075392.1 undecaprenyl/decaprenyl-phosphate alpha-N-acetylglucosaminyl 1-phosphate transferase [Chloroflexota bacterium]